MAFILRVLEVLFKILLLFFILGTERVIGLPTVFLTVAVSLLLLSRSISRYVYFVSAAFLLAVFYQLSFILAFLLIFGIYIGFVYLAPVIESNLQRFIMLLFFADIILVFISEIEVGFWIVVQLFISMFVSVIFLVKHVFVKYGFIGKKLLRT